MPDANARPPVLIPMPHGLGVNGVVSWALRLAGALAERGWTVGLMMHNEPAGHGSAGHGIPQGVRAFDLRHMPPMSAPGRPLSPYAQAYRDALAELGWSPTNPAVVLPNLDAGTFAVAAALSATQGDHLRVIGWQHSDIAFETTLLTAYEPMLAAMIGVSGHITATLRERLPWRGAEIHHIPYGVEIDTQLSDREPGPIRLLYAGRFEHEQKRIGVLLDLAWQLHERGIAHELRFVGDGPAAAEVEDRVKSLSHATRHPPANRQRMREHLRWADATLLASRYEGQSIAMLEAMAAGVVPIVTRVRSGASEAIEHGVNGLLIDGEEPAIAGRFADTIEQLDADHLAAMRSATHARAAERHGIGVHVDACARLFQSVSAAEPRWWPLDHPCTFGSVASPSGSVPPDAAERAAKAIGGIKGPIAIYGAGRHTLAIAEVLANANVACVIDDDPKNHGNTLWGWPIVGIEKLPKDSAVLISSFMHAHAMTARCVASGLRPIGLY